MHKPSISTTKVSIPVPNFGGTRAKISSIRANRVAKQKAELYAATLTAFGVTEPVTEEVTPEEEVVTSNHAAAADALKGLLARVGLQTIPTTPEVTELPAPAGDPVTV